MKKILLMLLALATLAACKGNKNVAVESSLLNTQWLLRSVDGEEVSTSSNGEGTQLFIFMEEGSDNLNGFAGCNRFFGSFEADKDGSLEISDIGATKMACDKLELETKFLAALDQVDSYTIKDNILYFIGDGKELATFSPSVIK